MTTVKTHRAPQTHWALAALSLSMLMPSLDTSIANAGLPALVLAFSASFQAVQWIVLAYLLAITTLIVSVGRLGDLVGRRRLLLAGITLFTVASLFCGIAPTLPLLIAARAVQGLGAATMLALTVAMVGETVPRERIGRAMGLLGTMSAIGTTLGPSLGGVLIAGLGWRTIFLVNVPLGVLNVVLARRYLPVDHHEAQVRRVRFDHLGTVLLSLSLAAYALAMTLGGGHFGSINMVLVAMAATGVGLFLAAESRAASPLVRVEMLRRHGLGAGLAMSTLVTTVVMATLVVGPFYLSRALGLGTAVVGLVLSIGPLVSALTGIPAGSAVDRFGARRIAVVGLGGMGIGALLLALLPLSAGLVGYIPCIAVITSGYALFQAANNTVIMSSANADHRGVVAGMLSLSRNLGLITGASAMAAVFALGAGGSGIMAARPADVSAGMRLTLAVAAALVITALAIASAGIRLTRWSESPASTSSLAKDGC